MAASRRPSLIGPVAIISAFVTVWGTQLLVADPVSLGSHRPRSSAVVLEVEGLVAQGRYAEAIAPVDEMVRRDPEDVALRRLQAVVLQGVGFFEAARHAWQQVVAADPSDHEASLALAILLERSGRNLEAQRLLVRLVRSPGVGPRARLEYGILLARGGRLDRAESFFVDDGLGKRDRARLLFNKGLLAKKTGDLPSAFRLFEESVGLEPAYPAAWNSLGLVAETLGRHAVAEAAWQRAQRLTPWDEAAWINLGRFLTSQGRFDEAVHMLGRVPAPGPDVLASRGVAQGMLGNHEAALKSFSASLAVRPDDGYTLFNRAVSLVSLGRIDDARSSLEDAVRAGYDDVELLRQKLDQVTSSDQVAMTGGEESLAAHDQKDGASGD